MTISDGLAVFLMSWPLLLILFLVIYDWIKPPLHPDPIRDEMIREEMKK